MDYRLSESDRELIKAAVREVFLGITLASGELLVRLADLQMYPGHTQWIQRDQIPLDRIVNAFSFIVKKGEVTGFFRSSELNRSTDWRLSDDEARAILALLPISAELKIY